MENQVKRQIKVNITNSPPAWGTPSRRGRTKENLTHFFGHYPFVTLLLQKNSGFIGQYRSLHTFGDSITLFRTAISIDKTKASVSKLAFDTDANYFVLFSKAESKTSNFRSEENQGLIIERTLTNLRVDVSRPTLLEANRDRLTFDATCTGRNNSTVVNRVTKTPRFGEGFICTDVHPMLLVGTALPLVGAVRITRYNTGREREGILIIDRS